MNTPTRCFIRFLAASVCTDVTFPLAAAEPLARVEFHDGSLRASGVAFAAAPKPGAIRQIAGPTPAVSGFLAADNEDVMRGQLDEPLVARGSLAFWFHTDQTYRSGSDAPEFRQKLVELPAALSVSFNAERNAVTLFVEWGGARDVVFDRHIRIILPEFPGPAWHHLAVNWDGAAGNLNAFLDGTPYYVPGEKLAPLATLPTTELVLPLSRLGLADVRVGRRPLSEDELRALVGARYRGTLDHLLGAVNLGPLTLTPQMRGRLLYARDLSKESDVAGWVLEGPGTIAFRDGFMEMRSTRPDGPQGHVVHWCPENFPARIAAEFDFELLGEKGLCILFFAATGHGGRDLFDPMLKPRSGVFEEYINGDIDCYHISYFANTPSEPRRVANLRKDRGFFLLSNGPVGVAKPVSGEQHHALLIKDGAHLQMAIDGRRIIDYVDDGRRAGPVYGGGKIGFRQMQWTAARYRNLRVFGLK